MLRFCGFAAFLGVLASGVVFLAGAAKPGAAPANPGASATTPAVPGTPGAPATPAAPAGNVARGEFLVKTGGCNDCHTPMVMDKELGMPAPDFSRMLAGHPAGAPDPQGTLGPQDQAVIGPTFTSFKLPFGVAYAANLTPDKTGLGGWTEKQFIAAMRTGRHVGEGRPILPPMPWMQLAALSDEDLRAMWAYLRTVPPVKNEVPAAKVDPAALDKLGQAYAKMLARMKSAPR